MVVAIFGFQDYFCASPASPETGNYSAEGGGDTISFLKVSRKFFIETRHRVPLHLVFPCLPKESCRTGHEPLLVVFGKSDLALAGQQLDTRPQEPAHCTFKLLFVHISGELDFNSLTFMR